MLSPVRDASVLRQAFSGFPSGVAALAAVVDDAPEVLVASSFTVGISQEPPLVLVAVQRTSSTWPRLASAPRIGISVLGERHAKITRQLAGKDRAARLDGVATSATPDGSLVFDGAPVWMECSVESTYPAGDHEIVVLRVESLATHFLHQPLVWHRSGFTTLVAELDLQTA